MLKKQTGDAYQDWKKRKNFQKATSDNNNNDNNNDNKEVSRETVIVHKSTPLPTSKKIEEENEDWD